MNGLIKIPFSNLGRQYESLREEILNVTDSVYRTGKVLDGPFTRNFESVIANRCNRRYAVAVNSGTQALVFALMALAPGRVGQVIAPVLSFYATLNSILLAGMEPKFVDADTFGSFNIDHVKAAVQELDHNLPNVIMGVDLFGDIPDYAQLESLRFFLSGTKLPIIEDAAQSFGGFRDGKPAGSFGDISILSFDPTKNLPNYGSGGMVLTNDIDVYKLLLDLRNNGALGGHSNVGTNSKMSESDCAQLLVKIKHFDKWQLRRSAIANYFHTYLKVPTHEHHPSVTPSYHKFVVYSEHRDSLIDHLNRLGIQTKIHYTTLLAECRSYLNSGNASLSNLPPFHCACDIAEQGLSIPIYPELTDSEVEYIVDSTNLFLKNTSR